MRANACDSTDGCLGRRSNAASRYTQAGSTFIRAACLVIARAGVQHVGIAGAVQVRALQLGPLHRQATSSGVLNTCCALHRNACLCCPLVAFTYGSNRCGLAPCCALPMVLAAPQHKGSTTWQYSPPAGVGTRKPGLCQDLCTPARPRSGYLAAARWPAMARWRAERVQDGSPQLPAAAHALQCWWREPLAGRGRTAAARSKDLPRSLYVVAG